MGVEKRTVFTRPDYLIVCGLGSGLVPKAPGTAGSFLGLLLFLPALYLPIPVQAGIIVAALAIGIVLSDKVSLEMKVKDPSIIVWDEFVGMWITMLWLPSLMWLPIAFILFRVFDVLKPGPIGWADRELAGGLGIMVDDVLAGVIALCVLQLMSYLLSYSGLF